MSKMPRLPFGELCDALLDFVWPRLVGDPPKGPEPRCLVESSFVDQLEHHLDRSEDRERESIRSVESRLIALLTLSSIPSVAVVAGLTFVFNFSESDDITRLPAVLVIVIVSYIAIQLLRTLWCALGGLTRRGYSEISADALLANESESCEEYRIRVGNSRLYNLEHNGWVINQKVSDMAVAHKAYSNALLGAFILVTLTLSLALFRIF